MSKYEIQERIEQIRSKVSEFEDIIRKLDAWCNGTSYYYDSFRSKRSAIMAAKKLQYLAEEINDALEEMDDYFEGTDLTIYTIPTYNVEDVMDEIKGDYFDSSADFNLIEIREALDSADDDIKYNRLSRSSYNSNYEEDDDDWNEWMDESEQHHTDEYPNYGSYTGEGNGHEGVEFVRGHSRRSYYRKDGTYVSATTVKPHKRRY